MTFDCKPCPLDPQPGEPVKFAKVDKHWRLNDRPTRIACIITSSENGTVFRDYCPETGDVIESGVVDLGQREAA